MGEVNTEDWRAAVELAKDLHAWRRERVRGSKFIQPRGFEETKGTLFGDDIAFNFDLDRPAEVDELDDAFPVIEHLGRSSPLDDSRPRQEEIPETQSAGVNVDVKGNGEVDANKAATVTHSGQERGDAGWLYSRWTSKIVHAILCVKSGFCYFGS